MVLCIIALIVFGILGIFSAKYRALAREAFECVWSMARLKPCQGDLEDRIRRGILKKTYRLSPKLAMHINRYFVLLSWLFALLFFASIALIIQGLYFYFLYGNCNGPNSSAFCVFDAFSPTSASGTECIVENAEGKKLTLPQSLGGHILGDGNAPITLMEIGCYTCPFTAQAEAAVQETLVKYGDKIRFAWKPFPLPSHAYSREAAEAAECASEQGKFWEYRAALLENQKKITDEGLNGLLDVAENAGISGTVLNACISSGKYKQKIEDGFQEGVSIGMYGTPTFFINSRAFVGPMAADEFGRIIGEELAKGTG